MPTDAPLFTLPTRELLARLGSSPSGLSSDEAAARLRRAGANEPAHVRPATVLGALASFVGNPLVVILLAAAAVAAALGQLVDASIIAVLVVLSIALNFVLAYRSHRAVERLRQTLAPTATVLRDGSFRELPRRDVVPGDVLRLSAGDVVPADARLLSARDLHAQQGALTGESLPVEKEAREPACSRMVDEPSVVLFGTSIVSGTATAMAIATGRDTAFGEVVASLASRRPETEFERGTKSFGILITKTVVYLVFFVFLSAAALHRPILESLLFAVALAVGLTPEFLPMITTVTLARGAVHMARERVIVKTLASIQNFGSIDVLCSDKTGTLTSGVMVLEAHTDPFGAPAERSFLLGYLGSLHHTGVATPLDHALLRIRSPLDEAILEHDEPDLRSHEKLDEIPFDFERRRTSVVLGDGNGRLLVTKGAPESVLAASTRLEVGGRELAMDDEARARARATFDGLGRSGYRVLAVARRAVEPKAAYSAADERELVLVGFLAFADPARDDSAAALASLSRDGVRVVILTGDNELVAEHVCRAVGLDPGQPILGDDLDKLSDPALGHVAERTTVFARVSPAQKNRVLLALKHRGHVVGFMGDGINDAPSLHAADVGISVSGAVDVAKDAADVILLAPGLTVLHRGIVEGRKAFGNVVKYLLMGTSSNFGNMFSMAAAFLFLPFLPMLPTQILLNNFLYDLAQVTIPTDRVDPSFVRKPRRWDVAVVRNFMLIVGPISSLYDFATFLALWYLLRATPELFHTGWFVESLATQTLVIFVIRTTRSPLRSRPSTPLLVTTLAAVAIGLALPFSPLAGALGFVPLPPVFFAFLAFAVTTYLALVALVRGRVMRRLAG